MNLRLAGAGLLVALLPVGPAAAQAADAPVPIVCTDCDRATQTAVSVPRWMYERGARAERLVWWDALGKNLHWTRLPTRGDLQRVPRGGRCRAIGTNLNRANRTALDTDAVIELMVEAGSIVLVDSSGRHAERRARSREYRQTVQRWRASRRDAVASAKTLLTAWIDNECGGAAAQEARR